MAPIRHTGIKMQQSDRATGSKVEGGRIALLACNILLIASIQYGALATAQPVFVPEAAAVGAAGDNELTLRAGVGHSDNILRNAALPEESGTYRAVGLDLSYNRPSTRIDIAVTSDLEFRSYSTSGIDNEPYGVLDADVVIEALPDRIRWLISDAYGQGRTDPFQVDGPANREQINSFSTGPQFDIPLGGRSIFRISHLLGVQNFQDTTRLDSDSTTTSASFLRALSSTANFGISVSQRQIEYEVSSFDNDITDTYLSYDKELSSGSATFELGSSEVDFGAGSNSVPFLNVDWDRELTARSHLRVTLGNSYQDAAETFRAADFENIVVERVDDVLLTADVFEQSSAGISYLLTLNRSSIELGASRLEDAYENATALDNERLELSLRWLRSISPRMDIRFDAATAERKYVNSDRIDKDSAAALGLTRDFASRMSIDFTLTRNRRSGTQSVEETSLLVFFNYGVS